MTVADDTRLRGKTRWSMSARCPRMGAYGLLGETPEEPDEEMQGLWERGKMDEAWWIERYLIPRYGRDGLQLQKAVEWGPGGQIIGELHPDAFVNSEGMPYEIKSHLDGDPAEFDYVQLCGEMHFDPDAGSHGALVVIDRNLKWEAIPVVLTSDRVDQVEEIARVVADAGMTGDLPDRVCEKPADGRSRMCPFVDVCFAGWTPPAVISLDDEVARLAVDVVLLDQARQPLKTAYEEADAAYKAAAAKLVPFELQPGRKYESDGGAVTIKRTHVADVEKISLKKLREAGVLTAEDEAKLAPFVTASGAHDRWAVTATDEAIAKVRQEDYGEEAPWSDEDMAEWEVQG